MITLEDLKTNRDTQITVGCIAFFLIAFPLYFSIAASGVSGVAGTRGVGCLLYTSPSPRDRSLSRMPSSA